VNTLDFPLYILENEDGTSTIMVHHDQVGSWNSAHNLTERAKTNNTRKFCNWIRMNLKEVPTEFRYMSKKRVRDYRYRSWSVRYKTINDDKCFVAYNVSRNDMMRIKLAWVFTTKKAELGGKASYAGDVWALDQTEPLEPSETLKKRMADKVAPKKVKEA
jgi:hypothetical protein